MGLSLQRNKEDEHNCQTNPLIIQMGFYISTINQDLRRWPKHNQGEEHDLLIHLLQSSLPHEDLRIADYEARLVLINESNRFRVL